MSPPPDFDLSAGRDGTKGSYSWGDDETPEDRAHRHRQEDRDNQMRHVYTVLAIAVGIGLVGFAAYVLTKDPANSGAWSLLSAIIAAAAGYLAGRQG